MNPLHECAWSYLYKETDTQVVQLLKFIIAIYILQHFALFFQDHLNVTAANIEFLDSIFRNT